MLTKDFWSSHVDVFLRNLMDSINAEIPGDYTLVHYPTNNRLYGMVQNRLTVIDDAFFLKFELTTRLKMKSLF